MFVRDEEIKKIITNKVEQRYAFHLDPAKEIERMSISYDQNTKIYRIGTRIDAGEDNKIITSINLSEEGIVNGYSCNCRVPGCRHVGMLLRHLKDFEPDEMPYCYEKGATPFVKQTAAEKEMKALEEKQRDAMNLIDFYKDMTRRDSKIPLLSRNQLKVEVKKEDGLKLSFKVIHDGKPYVIKSPEEFLKSLNNHSQMFFSKNFVLTLTEDAFDDDAKDIIEVMRQYYQYLQNPQLATSFLDFFYDTMTSLPSRCSDIAYTKDQVLFKLDIKKDKNGYHVVLLNPDYYSTMMVAKTSMYELVNDQLIRYQLNEQMIIFFEKIMNTRYGFYFPQSSLNDFYKYVYKDIEEFCEMDTSLFEDYHQENQISLYADMTDDHILCVQLEYLYDDCLEYGFTDHPYVSKEVDLVENYIESYIDEVRDNIIYFIDDDEYVYHFIIEGLPYLSNYCVIYISDTLKSISTQRKLNINVNIKNDHHLLEMNIESLDIDPDELYDVIKAYKKERKYYKLKNGQLLTLDSGELKELSSLSDYLSLTKEDFMNGDITLPEYRLFNLEEFSNRSEHLTYNRAESYKKQIENFNHKSEHPIPDLYSPLLRDYQKEGYRWLTTMSDFGFGGVLADDMGLGKTLQMLTYLEQSKKTNMVITPASLLLNWNDEIKKFKSDMKVLCILGKKEARIELIKTIGDYDLIITSYDYLRRDIALYEDFEFNTLVLDEAQNIKNPSTKNAECAKRLKAKQRFALTGTPIENSLTELWSIFDFLMPKYLYSYSMFSKNFEQPIVNSHDEERSQVLKRMVSPFILRRTKKQVLEELPDKIEKDLFFRMSEDEEKMYVSHLVQINKDLQKKLGMKSLGKVEVLSMLTRLRQICQDPRLIDNHITIPSTKVKSCMELIESLKENGHRILLFSSFTSVLDLLEVECQKSHISYYRLDGTVSKEKRKEMVDAFQKDNTTLFLISLKAGGTGLNLTSANAVIHFDPWWNMSAKNQATDRTHRIGQTDTVQVFSLFMKNSIEEKILNLQKEKMQLNDQFVEGNEGKIVKMTMNDLQSLFEIDDSFNVD